MEMFTIQEFAEICGGISYNGADKKIDGLIKKVKQGKLNGEINRNEELIEGKLTKVVYISRDLLEIVRKDKKVTSLTKSNHNEPVNIEPNVTNSKQNEKLNEIKFNSSEPLYNQFNPNEVINNLIQEVKTLALQAGAAKDVPLLTNDLQYNRDMVNKLHGDVAHWQKEYFELREKYNQIKRDLEDKQKEIERLNAVIDTEKKRPFWKKKFIV